MITPEELDAMEARCAEHRANQPSQCCHCPLCTDLPRLIAAYREALERERECARLIVDVRRYRVALGEIVLEGNKSGGSTKYCIVARQALADDEEAQP